MIAILYLLGVLSVAIYDRRVGVDPHEDPDWLMTGAVSLMWPMMLVLVACETLHRRRP